MKRIAARYITPSTETSNTRHKRPKRLSLGLLWWVCGLLLSLGPNLALGAGLWLPGIGANAMSRAGAFVSSGDDLTSLWHNPANLSRLQGLQFLNSNALIIQEGRYQRQTYTGSNTPFPAVEQTAPMDYAPFFGLSYDWGFMQLPQSHRFVLAIGMWRPHQTALRWGTEGEPTRPQRYDLLDGSVQNLYFALGLGYVLRLPTIKLRLGGTFSLVQTTIQERFVVQTRRTPTNNTLSDGQLYIETQSPLTPNGQVGFALDLPYGLGLGFCFQAAFPVTTNGTLTPTDETLRPLLQGDSLQLRYQMPWILRAGLSWKPTFFSRLLIEAAFVYEAWSQHESRILRTPTGSDQITLRTTGAPLDPIEWDQAYQNTWSTRIGVQIALVPELVFLRGGWLYETNAIPAQAASVRTPHSERHAASVGLEGRIPIGPIKIALQAAYMQTFSFPQEITTSDRRVIILTQNTQQRADTPGEVVTNGTYNAKAHLLLFSAAILWRGR